MALNFAHYFDRRLPRYTSYPTAPHFTADIDAAHYRRWLGETDPATPASLYLHVPFCRQLCWFCGCNTRVVRKAAVINAYRDCLMREIDLVAEALPGRQRINQIHFGGGSPNTLDEASFASLLAHIRRRFDVRPDAEIAVEIDPRTVGESFIAACGGAGVTRASLGVQDLDPSVQQAINRIQPYDFVAGVVERLRAAGITDINIDLMYGLPRQTAAGLLATVEQVLRLTPSRVALFGYAHVPWMKRHQELIDEAELPDTAARWRQADAATRRLAEAGYVPIGMDHFALPDTPLARASADGALHRNFQGYTTDDAPALLGLGASAIGMLPQGYIQNASDVRAWSAAIDAGALPTMRGIAVDDDDRLRRAVIERLMCDMRVDLDAIAHRFGSNVGDFADEMTALRALRQEGLVEINGAVLRVPPDNRALLRVVAAVFDRYLTHDTAAPSPRHAIAV